MAVLMAAASSTMLSVNPASLITLAEGPRMMARVEGIDPDKVEIGQKVKARISSLNGEPAVIFDIV